VAAAARVALAPWPRVVPQAALGVERRAAALA